MNVSSVIYFIQTLFRNMVPFKSSGLSSHCSMEELYLCGDAKQCGLVDKRTMYDIHDTWMSIECMGMRTVHYSN